MGRYENIVVLSPDITKEEEEELLKRIQGNLEKAGANIIRLDDWAVRRLAYPIKKKDRGHYIFFLLDMDEGNVAGMSKFYRTLDPVLRHMFVSVDAKNEGPKKPPDQVSFDEMEGEYS
ncbi:MAG: 30S ribosomal protein S6 [Syntrophus sp. (in: bacteria)]|nr:30S ribosomal protein S6 [Syntrophus sp. (in: bacteria)]